MHGTEVWQGRKVKINHPTGEKKKRSAVFYSTYPPKVTL